MIMFRLKLIFPGAAEQQALLINIKPFQLTRKGFLLHKLVVSFVII